MKKLKKSISNLQTSKINFDQLSQIKGGKTYPHDLFAGIVRPYKPAKPPRA